MDELEISENIRAIVRRAWRSNADIHSFKIKYDSQLEELARTAGLATQRVGFYKNLKVSGDPEKILGVLNTRLALALGSQGIA